MRVAVSGGGAKGGGGAARDDRADRGASLGGRIFDALFFVAVVGLSAALVMLGTILPNARKAARAEREVAAAEARVDALAADVERLRLEVVSLRSDPWAIERELKRKAKELRPDLFPTQPLPPTATADAVAVRPE